MVILMAGLVCILCIAFSGKKAPTVAVNTSELLPSSSSCDQVVIHTAYSLCYSEKDEQARWVAYKLTSEMCTTNAVKRVDKFIPDPLVKTGSSESNDFKNSGYDRGHLCPAGDMNWSDATMKESFYMSNMSPQLHAFNAGIWEKLETKVRKWAVAKGEVFVVDGPVLTGELKKIGVKNKVTVPDYFYKIVYSSGSVLAFVIQNKDWDQKSFYDFCVPVDSIEKLTGIDFFPLMNDTLENELEKRVRMEGWK